MALRVHRVCAMMDDGRVHHRGVRHHGSHGHHSGIGVCLGGGDGGEHEQLRRIRVHGLASLVGLTVEQHVAAIQHEVVKLV